MAPGVALAAESKAQVQGEMDRALKAEIQRAVGTSKAHPTSRVDARRRAREAGESAIAVLRSEGFYDYTVDPDIGNFTTTFNGQTFTDAAFLDTGSNAIYFANSAMTGMATCSDLAFFYCPGSTQNFTAMNMGANGTSRSVSFSIENADALLANASNFVAPNLGGPNPGAFDWGLPFFFGRNVYTAIEGKSTPGGTGPYVAF